MARKRHIGNIRINLATTDACATFSEFVTEATKASVAARYEIGGASAWSTAVITIEKSLDGKLWATTGTTIGAEGITSDIDISTAYMIRARVSTAQSSAGYAFITVGLLLGDEI